MSLELLALALFVAGTSIYLLVGDYGVKRLASIVGGLSGLVYVVLVLIHNL